MPTSKPDFTAACRLLDQWTGEGTLPGAAVLVQQHGEPLLEYAAGAACLEPYIPATTEHIWAIASISKPVAATGLMQLVEQGKLHLAQPVSEVLPEYTGPGLEQVLVRHLVTHQSGIPDRFPDRDMMEQYGITAAIASLELLYTPGTGCSYSTVAFQLLGEVVRKVTGQDWVAYSDERIFAPLEMRDSSFRPPASWNNRIAVVYNMENSDKTWPNDPSVRAFAMPGGGMFSTLQDLARFGQAFLSKDERLLSLDGYRQMLEVQTPGLYDQEQNPASWGLGWYLNQDGRIHGAQLLTDRAFWHGGATATRLFVEPNFDAVIVFLANRVELAIGSELHGQLADAILGELPS